MFKHILVPISDDKLTQKGLKEVVKLAKTDMAKVTLAYISDPLGPYMYSDMAIQFVISEKEHQDACNRFAQRLFLKVLALLPKDLEVDTSHIFHSNIADGIIEAAINNQADVIMMASHKRKGIQGFFLRSEANEVIMHSSVPVMILNT